jgi:uncharacterized protein YndB with AHSA1/START domain
MTEIPETHREVGRRRIAAGDARTAIIRRTISAPIETVWAACSEPDRLNRFFLPVTGNLRPGGNFQFQDQAGGQILRCDPPHHIAVTWDYPGRAVDEVTLHLSPGPNGDTVLELEHATVTKLVEWDGQMFDVIPGVAAPWETILDYLAKYLRGELPDAPGVEWYTPNPEDQALDAQRTEIWTALADSAPS